MKYERLVRKGLLLGLLGLCTVAVGPNMAWAATNEASIQGPLVMSSMSIIDYKTTGQMLRVVGNFTTNWAYSEKRIKEALQAREEGRSLTQEDYEWIQNQELLDFRGYFIKSLDFNAKRVLEVLAKEKRQGVNQEEKVQAFWVDMNRAVNSYQLGHMNEYEIRSLILSVVTDFKNKETDPTVKVYIDSIVAHAAHDTLVQLEGFMPSTPEGVRNTTSNGDRAVALPSSPT